MPDCSELILTLHFGNGYHFLSDRTMNQFAIERSELQIVSNAKPIAIFKLLCLWSE